MSIRELNHKKISIALAVGPIVLTIGTVLFHGLEDWTWIQSFYFTVITVTTVGYGDLQPSSDISRLATSMFVIFGILALLAAISYAEVRYVDNRNCRKHT